MSPPMQLVPALLLLACFWTKLITAQRVGPYEYITVTELSMGDDSQDLAIIATASIEREKKERWATWNATVPFDIDGEIKAKIIIKQCDSSDAQECKDYSDMESENACEDAMKNIPDVMKQLAECAGIPNECPIPAGTYVCEKMPLKISPLENYKQLPFGAWLIGVDLLKGDTKVGFFGGRGDVEEAAHEG